MDPEPQQHHTVAEEGRYIPHEIVVGQFPATDDDYNEQEGPYTLHEMVIGPSPILLSATRDNNINISTATEPDPEQEILWMRPIQETGPHYPVELA